MYIMATGTIVENTPRHRRPRPTSVVRRILSAIRVDVRAGRSSGAPFCDAWHQLDPARWRNPVMFLAISARAHQPRSFPGDPRHRRLRGACRGNGFGSRVFFAELADPWPRPRQGACRHLRRPLRLRYRASCVAPMVGYANGRRTQLQLATACVVDSGHSSRRRPTWSRGLPRSTSGDPGESAPVIR